jgi:hypothetical protein
MRYPHFAQLFNQYRLKSGFSTLSDFGKELAEEGFYFEDSTFSRWKHGSRIPKQPEVLSAIVRIFVRHHGIETSSEVQQFYLSVGQPPPQKFYMFDKSTEFCIPTYLCKHILGEAFFNLYYHKLKKLYPLASKDLPAFVLTLHQIERQPQQFLDQAISDDLTLRDATDKIRYIKKLSVVSKHVQTVMFKPHSFPLNYFYVPENLIGYTRPIPPPNSSTYVTRYGLSN